MIIIGLTGSIAMGKSTIAAMFENEGVPVHDADAAVHRLLAPDGSGFAPVTAAFEGIVGGDGRIDRQALGRAVFGNDDKRHQLEAILHPLVKQDRQAWLEEKRTENADIAVLDIPLLFETGGAEDCDQVVVVSASPQQQERRAMARPGMTAEKFAAILKAQMPDQEKRVRADHVIPTSFGETASRWYVRRLINQLRGQQHA